MFWWAASCTRSPACIWAARWRAWQARAWTWSDGLSQDLPRLLGGSGLAARVEVERLPLSAELIACAGRERARQLAWSGGDDYELCFTVSPENENRLASMPAPVTRIGELHRGDGLELSLDGSPGSLQAPGFRIFSAVSRLAKTRRRDDAGGARRR